jgi:hypothetical protein
VNSDRERTIRVVVFVAATVAELPVIVLLTQVLLPNAGLVPALAFFVLAVYIKRLLSGHLGA